MTAEPTWESVDNYTADLLELVADIDHPSVDHEWDTYVRALRNIAATRFGTIPPNVLREAVRGKVAPRRVGAFANRALSQGLVEHTGDWEISNDTTGRNAGKPMRVMRWKGGAK